jgi:hypothetical protein
MRIFFLYIYKKKNSTFFFNLKIYIKKKKYKEETEHVI